MKGEDVTAAVVTLDGHASVWMAGRMRFMVSVAHRARYTRAEYVAFERSSNVKHEFLDGVIYAMAGGSPQHAAVAATVITLLSVGLQGKPCRVHSSDLRIRIADTGLETYPDVSVVCGRAEVDPEDAHAVLNPIVVVEVTSPSTEEYDRGDKAEHYKRIPSLREIVLVSHRERLVEVLRREEGGEWSRHEARVGETARLVSLECELRVDEVYRDPLAP
jgi:Uma2 family endonuclease